MNMKSNLMNHTPVARVLALIVALATVTVLATNAADDKNPASPAPGKPLAMDPATGLPVPPAPSWKDPNWKDPDKVLTDVSYDSLPLLEIALRAPVAYVGAMGSRRTNEDRLDRLKELGMTHDELSRLHAPIGLDVGARTPEETAVSIAGEIIALRWGGTGTQLRQIDGPIHRSGGSPGM